MSVDPIEEMMRKTDEASRLLPAWFVPRMMDDEWSFGLLLITGHTLCITHIDNVHQAADGSLWIDADMQEDDSMVFRKPPNPLYAPTSRLHVSINADHVVAAFELADT